MRVKRARVQHYRSVLDSEWIDVDPSTTTLIGKNESGKTSILEAIAFFSNESECDDRDINSERDYPGGEKIPIISLEI